VPEDSPFDRHLLVWSRHDELQASFISDVPDALACEGSIFHLQ
jgi:hypothetical protein